MKNSMKFIWIVLGAIAVVLIVLTIMVRSMVAEHIVVGEKGGSLSFTSDSGPTVTSEYNFEDFTEIKVVGGWDIKVVADDEYAITVETAERSADQILVVKRGGSLYLGLKNSFLDSNNNFHGASAVIHMPELASVDVDGAVNLKMSDFNTDYIRLQLDGAGQIVGEDCIIGNLFLESNGAVNIDFKRSSIENAEVNIDGAGNVELDMAGGELTGRLSGLANLMYSGNVSRLEVREDGISNVEHRN